MAKRCLHEYGLRVLDYEFIQGREIIEGLKLNKSRRYSFGGVVEGRIYTNQGTLYFKTELGFECDMRSGPKLVDWYVPNLGSLDERMAWLMHDALGYGQSLGFHDTNRILRYFLRDICGYRKSKAWLIEQVVGLDASWYGRPEPADWCYANLGLVETTWKPR